MYFFVNINSFFHSWPHYSIQIREGWSSHMKFTCLMQFLHLLLGNIRSELLVLIGDSKTLSELVDVQRELKIEMPSMIACVSNIPELCLLDCPKRRLTLFWLNDKYIRKASTILWFFPIALRRIELF